MTKLLKICQKYKTTQQDEVMKKHLHLPSSLSMTLKCTARVSQMREVLMFKMKQLAQKVLQKYEQELKLTMLRSISVRTFKYIDPHIDNLGGIIDHHESEVKFSDKSKISSLR